MAEYDDAEFDATPWALTGDAVLRLLFFHGAAIPIYLQILRYPECKTKADEFMADYYRITVLNFFS